MNTTRMPTPANHATTAQFTRDNAQQEVDRCMETLRAYGYAVAAISPAERRDVNPEALREAMLAAGRQFIAQAVHA